MFLCISKYFLTASTVRKIFTIQPANHILVNLFFKNYIKWFLILIVNNILHFFKNFVINWNKINFVKLLFFRKFFQCCVKEKSKNGMNFILFCSPLCALRIHIWSGLNLPLWFGQDFLCILFRCFFIKVCYTLRNLLFYLGRHEEIVRTKAKHFYAKIYLFYDMRMFNRLKCV